MKISNLRDAETALRQSLVAVENDLAATDAVTVRELLDAGETGLAFDTLCTQLYEFDITVGPDTMTALDAVGRYFHLNPDLWTVIGVSESARD